MREYLKQLGRRKDLLLYLVSSGLKAQHRNSLLGYFWWLLDPLLNLIIYFFVVEVVFQRGGPDYILYLVISLSVWRWFHTTVTTATRSIVAQSGIIAQVYLPKAIFPFGAVLTQLFNFSFSLVVVGLFLLAFREIPGPEVLWLPVIMLMQMLFMTAIALPLAYVAVFVRDMNNLVDHLMRLWFYASPVIWMESAIPQHWHWLLNINPFSHFLSAYRDVLLGHSSPDMVSLLAVVAPSVLVIIFGTYYYSRHEHRLIKVL